MRISDWRSDVCSSDLDGCLITSLEPGERLEITRGVPGDGNGQVEPVDRPFNMSSDMVHDTNHQRRVFRILEMRVICVAITEMETELHAGRHPGRDLDHSADQCLEIADRCRKDTLEDGELKRGIPLYRQLNGDRKSTRM